MPTWIFCPCRRMICFFTSEKSSAVTRSIIRKCPLKERVILLQVLTQCVWKGKTIWWTWCIRTCALPAWTVERGVRIIQIVECIHDWKGAEWSSDYNKQAPAKCFKIKQWTKQYAFHLHEISCRWGCMAWILVNPLGLLPIILPGEANVSNGDLIKKCLRFLTTQQGAKILPISLKGRSFSEWACLTRNRS